MTKEEYNNIISKFESLTPAECVRAMYEMTDEDGRLEIPAWPNDYELEQEEAYYVLKMEWDENEREAGAGVDTDLIEWLIASFVELGRKWKNGRLGMTSEENRTLLTEYGLFNIWETFVKSPCPGDMDYMKFYDISEKVEQIALREAGKNDAEFAPGRATVSFELSENAEEPIVSLEELKYYNEYIDRVNEEAKRRLGGKYAQYDQIIRASRLCKLVAQDAPQILIDNEARLFTQAWIVGRYAVEMKERKCM